METAFSQRKLSPKSLGARRETAVEHRKVALQCIAAGVEWLATLGAHYSGCHLSFCGAGHEHGVAS